MLYPKTKMRCCGSRMTLLWLLKRRLLVMSPRFSAERFIHKSLKLARDNRLTGYTQMDRFFIYEEYGAKYEMMIRDVASTHRTMPQWEHYQRGLEVLASSLISFDAHGYRSRKSLTIGDLLVKASFSAK